MRPADASFWIRARNRAANLQPDIAAAIFQAFRIIRAALDDADIVALLRSGSLDAMIDALLSDVLMARAFIPLRTRLRKATQASFQSFVSDLPNAGKVNGQIAVSFDYLNPKVVQAVQDLDSKIVQGLADSTRQAVKLAVQQGLHDGDSVQTIAQSLRSVIGLSPTQVANAANYEAQLAADGATNVDARVAAYTKRAVSLNAETNARTAALDAMKLGHKLSWQAAVDAEIVPANGLTKTWVGVMDDRERDEHIAMEGETVPFDALYSNGEDVPGESTYNCRCLSRFRVAA